MDPGLKDLDSNARVPFLELNSLVPDFVYQKTVVEDKRPFSSKSIQVCLCDKVDKHKAINLARHTIGGNRQEKKESLFWYNLSSFDYYDLK